jgi:hypothetical protein
MTDYTWPSIYFSYFFFAICLFAAIYFFLRSWHDGYWGPEAEEIKYIIFEADPVSAGGAGWQPAADCQSAPLAGISKE